ncbi:hypothetical protein NDN08_004289 [Rhodosorus marinus]|uniref:Dolichol phosphate-mannose biosynthesis regulatory protein n=1 Tax=Rhodosorus marinus TaxID=101924 RepID=A0AAV8UL97_9RHOD|nr:hypothetical protein NDN08_004289 [Rhodosorus marinus]
MATSADRVAGFVLVLISVIVFLYWTCWIFGLPFVGTDSALARFFLAPFWGVFIPAGVLLCLSNFLGLLVWTQDRGKSNKQE